MERSQGGGEGEGEIPDVGKYLYWQRYVQDEKVKRQESCRGNLALRDGMISRSGSRPISTTLLSSRGVNGSTTMSSLVSSYLSKPPRSPFSRQPCGFLEKTARCVLVVNKYYRMKFEPSGCEGLAWC